jgi:flagellar basal body-associated protein FliL
MEAKIKMDTVEDTEYNVPPKRRKWLRNILFVLIVVLVIGVGYISVWNGWFLSESAKDEAIGQTYWTQGYTEAVKLARRYYGYSETGDSWVKVLGIQQDEKSQEKLINQIEIVEQNLGWEEYGYRDYTVTLKNNSKETIRYIKVDIFLKDENKEIVHSDWTNWSGTLPPGASTTLDTTIKYSGNYMYYSVRVDEVSAK